MKLLSHQVLEDGVHCENGREEWCASKGRTINKSKLVVFSSDTDSIREEVALVPCNLGK